MREAKIYFKKQKKKKQKNYKKSGGGVVSKLGGSFTPLGGVKISLTAMVYGLHPPGGSHQSVVVLHSWVYG